MKLSRSRCEADGIERKALEEKELASKKKKLEEITRKSISEKESESISGKIDQCKCSLKVADDLILDAKSTLQESLPGKNVDRQLVQKALAKIEIGTERKRKIDSDLEVLHSKKKKTLSG